MKVESVLYKIKFNLALKSLSVLKFRFQLLKKTHRTDVRNTTVLLCHKNIATSIPHNISLKSQKMS